jgi:uncharacterized protein YerC
MVRLNKNLLTDQQFEQLFIQFIRIVDPKKSAPVGGVLREILGKEERIMIAKRLATIVLLLEGKSLYSIAHTLKISPTTAEKIKRHLDDGSYTTILSRLSKSKRNYFAILDTIDSILHLGGILPHYNGLDRYKNIR